MSSFRHIAYVTHVTRSAAAACLLLLATGCGEESTGAEAPEADMPPPEVAVITVTPEPLVTTTELPGRLEATRLAQVRARVPGIVLKRVFREGSDVEAGDVLFQIDPAPYRAARNSAKAALAKAEANLAQAELTVRRYQPLVKTNAISKQEFDDAQTAQEQAVADVAAARAALETAQLNLSYATVTAPISGRIGRAEVTEGALVGQGEATPLATVQQIDPIYVNLTQSSTEFLQLQRAMASGQLKTVDNGQAGVTLMMEDGRAYPHAGKLLFSDLSVDPSSGAVSLRAIFPNPDRFLLPGMYVRARIEQGVKEQAISIPQQALQRNQGGAWVMVVSGDDKVEMRAVKVHSTHGNAWVISSGLKAGERVIVEGFQKVQPGAPVSAVPWRSASTQGAAGHAQALQTPKAN